MAFEDSTLEHLRDRLGLAFAVGPVLRDAPPVALSDFLAERLADGLTLARAGGRKAWEEFVVAPLLQEARRLTGKRAFVWSGVDFDGWPPDGLCGPVGFLIARDATPFILCAPALAAVEVRPESTAAATGPAAAVMMAAVRFNARKRADPGPVFGVATSGAAWRFLRLDDDVLTVDPGELFINDPAKILGVLVRILGGPPVQGQST